MNKKDKEQWIPIPGIETYDISLDFPFRVRNAKTGYVLSSKEPDVVHIHEPGHSSRTFRTARLAYCAMHGINARNFTTDAIVLMDGKTPVLYSRTEYYRSVIRKVNEGRKREENPIPMYEKEIEFATMLIQAFRSNDFTPVSNYLFDELYEKLITYFTENTAYALPADEAKYISTEAIMLLLSTLQDGVVICTPYKYAKKLAIRIIKSERNNRKRLSYYNDALIYREAL